MPIQPVRLIEVDPILLAGMDGEYTFQSMGDIPQQWQRFVPYLGALPGQTASVSYGVSHQSGQNGFRYFCGVPIAAESVLPSELSTYELTSRRYAVFAHQGHVSQLHETIQAAWKDWLPQSGEQTPAQGYTVEFYGEFFDPQSGFGDTEVWIPIL